jgi:uroporphyrinogen decarboxylase
MSSLGEADLERHALPGVDSLLDFSHLLDRVLTMKKSTDLAISADPVLPGFFEFSWWLRGFEQFCVDLSQNRDVAELILSKCEALFVEIYDKYLDSVGGHIDIVVIGDDYGTQNGLIISPDLFRHVLKPRLSRWITFIKSKAKDARIQFHSCGAIEPLIGDLIDVGVDIINPVQVSAHGMDLGLLKKKYGKSLSFNGAIDTQRLLPFASPERIAEEVQRTIRILGDHGGYIVSSVHNIQPDVPPQSIVCMFESANKYGKEGKETVL